MQMPAGIGQHMGYHQHITARKALNYLYLHFWRYRTIGRDHLRRVEAVAARQHCRVVLLAMSVPMWRYQHLYERLASDPRFTTTIVISPALSYAAEQQRSDVEALRNFFNSKNIPYIDWHDGETPFDIKGRLDPDVIFYPQPYEHLLTPEHDCLAFYDRLVAYYPYSFMTGNGKFNYNFHFHNLAWRLYYSSEQIRAEAERTAWNRARNVRVVGFPNADDFLQPHFADPWKRIDDGRQRKRLVWAPHFSFENKFGQTPRGNFLWMAFFMVDLAQRYKEHLQIAFKPHPRLLTELYAHPEWGKTRTDNFYRLWATMENTQLELGGYVDLLMTSDAMVHDCASFVVEYQYTLKPVMYVSRNLDALLSGQIGLSRQAFELHYIGHDEREVLDFVDRTVMGGDDPLLPQRETFRRNYLLPPGGNTVAQNTIDDLVKSLKLPPLTAQ